MVSQVVVVQDQQHLAGSGGQVVDHRGHRHVGRGQPGQELLWWTCATPRCCAMEGCCHAGPEHRGVGVCGIEREPRDGGLIRHLGQPTRPPGWSCRSPPAPTPGSACSRRRARGGSCPALGHEPGARRRDIQSWPPPVAVSRVFTHPSAWSASPHPTRRWRPRICDSCEASTHRPQPWARDVVGGLHHTRPRHRAANALLAVLMRLADCWCVIATRPESHW